MNELSRTGNLMCCMMYMREIQFCDFSKKPYISEVSLPFIMIK
jgi:hypothetical protein